MRQLDVGSKPISMREWNDSLGIGEVDDLTTTKPLNYVDVSKCLHCVLQDKCEDSEGLSRIRSAKGDGIRAYFDMYSWYLGRSGQ